MYIYMCLIYIRTSTPLKSVDLTSTHITPSSVGMVGASTTGAHTEASMAVFNMPVDCGETNASNSGASALIRRGCVNEGKRSVCV